MDTLMKIAGLQAALEQWDEVVQSRDAYVKENMPEGHDGDPLCGYSDWDEAMADYNEGLAERGAILAEVVREALG